MTTRFPRRLGRLTGPAFTALALALVPATVAYGIAKVGTVRVAGDAEGSDGGEVYTAPEGAESVHVLFDYTGASRTEITVRVVANGLTVFEASNRYTGDGTASVEVTGAAVYRKALSTMVSDAEQLGRDATELATEDGLIAGQAIELINQIEGRANGVEAGILIVEALDLGGARLSALEDLAQALADIGDAVDAAVDLPGDDIAGRQQIGAEIQPLADRVDDALATLDGVVAGLDDPALPTTGTDWSFDATVRTGTSSGSSPSGSARFMVHGTTSRSEDEPNEPTARPSPTSRGNAGSDNMARGAGTPTPRATAASGASGDAGGQGDAGGGSASSAGGRAARPTDASASGVSIQVPSSEGDAGIEEAGAPNADAVLQDAPDAPAAAGDDAVAMIDAQPTWTVPAGQAADAPVADSDAGDPSSDASGAGAASGPNLAVLGLGVVLLVGAALWFRRRA